MCLRRRKILIVHVRVLIHWICVRRVVHHLGRRGMSIVDVVCAGLRADVIGVLWEGFVGLVRW